MFYQMIAATL